MHMCHAQRQHIIHSLDALLYQLHTLCFFLSPSLLPYLCRAISQFQFSRPRDLHPKRSLRFWFIIILMFNFGSVWVHATEGASEGRSVMLDFVGMAHLPSKLHLLCLDALIIFLQMLLTTIAYESSLSSVVSPDTPDPLLPLPNTSDYSPLSSEDDPKNDQSEIPYVLDLRIGPILQQLRSPPPPPPETDISSEDLLPLPNTTPWQITRSLRVLMRARARMRERERARAEVNAPGTDRQVSQDLPSRVPGAMESDDGT